jgi:hypothetical protein
MSFDEYKKIHVLFSHENPKSQLSLEIKTNPKDEMDVKVKLKFLYEFGLKEFNNNSVMLAFEIDGDSLTNEIKNDFKYILPDVILKEAVENNNENEIINSKKDMILIEKIQNNEMMLSRQKLIKKDIVTDNEKNLMINSKKYHMFADQIKSRKDYTQDSNVEIKPETEYNAIVNNLILNMNKFKHNIDEYNIHNEEKIELDNKPIMEYINNEQNFYSDVIEVDVDESSSEEKTFRREEDVKSQSSSMNSSESTKKYKIKNSENDIDINSIKIKKMNVEDKLLQLLDDDPLDYRITLQKKIDYQLRLTTAMNNISPTKNIIFIITELMKYIDNFEINGEDKKNIIISSVKTFLKNEKINEQDVNFIVNTVCPELIDILISVDKRNITIKKKISCTFPWCS